MILDFRVRPPFGKSMNTAIFDPARRKVATGRFGQKVSQSVLTKSMDLFMQEMDDAGIYKAVIQIRSIFNVDSTEIEEVLKLYPNRFYAMLGINPTDDKDYLEQAVAKVKNGPYKGFTLEPLQNNPIIPINDKKLYSLYQLCEENEIPISITFGGMGPNLEFTNPIHLEQMTADFNELKVVITHGGWPYAAQICQTAVLRKNLYICPDIYAVNVPGSTDYLAAANYFIPEKIIFASSYPVLPLEGATEYYKNHLRSEVYDLVMFENGMRLLGE